MVFLRKTGSYCKYNTKYKKYQANNKKKLIIHVIKYVCGILYI